MKKLFASVILVLLTGIFLCACSKKDAGKSLLDEVSGVWRAKTDGAMVSIIYADKKMRLFIGENPVSVTLGEIDDANKTINLNVTTNLGKPGVWTIRQIWDKEHKSFYLQMTLHDGIQDELTFVRKISSDDMNRFANSEAKQTGAIGAAAKSSSEQPQTTASEPPPNPDVSNQNQPSPQANWSPSFDCAKVSNGPERLICSNKELSEADVQLAQAYKAALKNSSNKGTLKQQQAAWLKNERNASSDAESMLRVYKERIAVLSK
ncbi:MAG: lysozyme inhibitor LprI family protein [Oryzomonas sp.]|uniref:lysozyme inhibitor LprI family protein n=1 Tax=Oryzomonas sp. TaxID=2855186 RepID=UPI00283F9BCE|nr:lysozyme inhibitor LprI family protein [Oryzomonas sp.]MDR3580734.1 lysozyme inhibitor LprI family protein [Oryzomonas sp.]